MQVKWNRQKYIRNAWLFTFVIITVSYSTSLQYILAKRFQNECACASIRRIRESFFKEDNNSHRFNFSAILREIVLYAKM